MENRKRIEDFCDKYHVDKTILSYYISSVEINDMPSMDTYLLLITESCPQELLDEMRSDLKALIKDKYNY